MTRHLHGISFRAVLVAFVACLGLLARPAAAEDDGFKFIAPEDSLYLYAGSYIHFSPSNDHGGAPWSVGAEVRTDSDWIYGLNLFNNSFNQFSQYLYLGRRVELPLWSLHAKVTGGVIQGYSGRFDDKLPVQTSNNFAPAVIFSLGRDFGRWEASVNTLGLSGLMFSLGYDIWR